MPAADPSKSKPKPKTKPKPKPNSIYPIADPHYTVRSLQTTLFLCLRVHAMLSALRSLLKFDFGDRMFCSVVAVGPGRSFVVCRFSGCFCSDFSLFFSLSDSLALRFLWFVVHRRCFYFTKIFMSGCHCGHNSCFRGVGACSVVRLLVWLYT